MTEAPLFYTTRTATAVLPYSEERIRALCADGVIPGAMKLTARKWLISRVALEQFVAEKSAAGHKAGDSGVSSTTQGVADESSRA